MSLSSNAFSVVSAPHAMTITTTTTSTTTTGTSTIGTDLNKYPPTVSSSSTSSSTTIAAVGVGSNTTTSSAPAFWELDIPNGSTTGSSGAILMTTTTTTVKKSSYYNNNSSELLLMTWLRTQMTMAVSNAIVTKTPITTTTTTTNTSTIANDDDDDEKHRNHQTIANVMCTNLVTAVQSLRVTNVPSSAAQPLLPTSNHTTAVSADNNNNNVDEEEEEEDDDNMDDDNVQQRRKRRKIIAQKRVPQQLHDPYHIWFQKSPLPNDNDNEQEKNDIGQLTSPQPTGVVVDNHNNNNDTITLWNDEQDDIPTGLGGKLAVLSVGGIFNAISLCHICTTPIVPHSSKLLLQQAVMSGTIVQWKQQQQLHVSTLTNVTIGHLYMIATFIHSAIAERVKYDIVRTTPSRIQLLLASDLTSVEFQGVRRRLHDTVILGKGVQQQHAASTGTTDDGNSNNDTTLAVGTMSQQQHAIDKYKKCPGCGNNDQSEFILDRKNGDLICSNCGIVVSESIMHEGSQFRKFEGEIDRNHHGDASNPLYSNAHNMGTSLSTVMPTSGAGMGGRGSGGGSNGGRRNLETILKNAHAYTELNVSQFGRTDARRTRVGYKDRQKKSAFAQMTHAGDALNLHEAVVQRAKELFAGFRDDRELVHQFKGILAACLCEAFEQLSAEGKHLLRQQQQMSDQQRGGTSSKVTTANATGLDGENSKALVLSGRAARRSELHHATMAGKGGILLNTPITSVVANTTAAAKSTPMAVTDKNGSSDDQKQEKLAAAWDLEDCRSWLLTASRSIAQTWFDERKKHPDAANTTTGSTIPTGSVDELEGRLVEHAITLCEHLENEMQSRATSSSISSGRVTTPRLSDMTKIGIKWQHSHERGSGGKGGVGGSGVTAANTNSKTRTAGQILLLKTSKKLGSLLNDVIAGDAIHRELRNVITHQEVLKQKEMRNEATRQRLNQMQRKPWLAAKAQK